MEDKRLDILAPRENQIEILVPYLEAVAKGSEAPLPLTMRSTVLFKRYLWYWQGSLTKGGMTPRAAFTYYKKLGENK